MGVEGGADSRGKNEMPETNQICFVLWLCGCKDQPFCKFVFLPHSRTKIGGWGGSKAPKPRFFWALALLISISAGS